MFITCVVFGVFVMAVSAEDARISQCGANSLYLSLRYLGVDCSLQEVYAITPSNADGNVSIGQLRDCAVTKGLHVRTILEPSIQDVNRSLVHDTSVILQYVGDVPDSRFKHIIALIKPKDKILIMDYPKLTREIDAKELAELVSHSEGMLVLSKRPMVMAELLNMRSLKSWGFYAMCSGAIMLAISGVRYARGRRKGKAA